MHTSAQREDEGADDGALVKIDLRTSAVKPVHAHWIIDAHEKMSCRPDLVQDGFKKAGLL
jgi:hypothetical protein